MLLRVLFSPLRLICAIRYRRHRRYVYAPAFHSVITLRVVIEQRARLLMIVARFSAVARAA